jgi:hypothetical protein
LTGKALGLAILVSTSWKSTKMADKDGIFQASKSLVKFTYTYPYLAVPIIAAVLVMTLSSRAKSFDEKLRWVIAINDLQILRIAVPRGQYF